MSPLTRHGYLTSAHKSHKTKRLRSEPPKTSALQVSAIPRSGVGLGVAIPYLRGLSLNRAL